MATLPLRSYSHPDPQSQSPWPMNAEGQSYETSPQFSAYSSRPKVGPDGYVDAAISMADRCELPENEVSEFCDKSRSGRMSWESLEEVIKKTFEEAAQLIAHDSTKCQHGSNMQSKPSKHPRSETTSIQTSPATRCDKAAKDIQVPRRPQHHDEYWSVSPKAWAKLSETRRGVLSHVGRINETSDGQEAPGGECKKCDESGSDCMIYCERTLGTHHPLGGVSACSRCRFSGLACSFDVAGKTAAKKRKADCSGARPSLVKRTRLQ